MRRFLPFLIAISLGTFALGLTVYRLALADASGSAVLVQATNLSGSGSSIAISSPTTPATPVATLHDPLEAPLAALDDARAAKKTSWPLAVFAVLAMLTKALAYGAATLRGMPLIGVAAKWLATDKHAMWIAGLGTLVAAGYNTLVTGGTWVAVIVAIGVASAGLVHSTTQPAKAA